MSKLPAFQFYPGDWLRDPQLRMASPASRGIWIDLPCHMWNAPRRGVLVGTVDQLQRLASCSETDFSAFLNEIEALKFGDLSRETNGQMTLACRRMVRDEKVRKDGVIRQRRYSERNTSRSDDAVMTGSVTLSSPKNHIASSSSSSSSKTDRSVRPKRSDAREFGFEKFYEPYPRHEAKKDALKAWVTLNPSPELQDRILANIAQRKTSVWRDCDPKHIPLPASYLRGDRWNDELVVPGAFNGNGAPPGQPFEEVMKELGAHG